MLIDKEQVRRRFARAADTYDAQSIVQRGVAEKLLALLIDTGCTVPTSVLEIGCCTGLLTELLLHCFPSISLLHVNDLVASFRKPVKDKIRTWAKEHNYGFIPGDIETIYLPRQYNLILSSSTFHWLHDLPLLFAKLHNHLLPGGYLAFAMYGPDNLQEIRQITGTGLPYPDAASLQKILSAHYEILACTDEHKSIHFADPMALLRHLRQTGVNAIERTPWTKSQLNQFISAYTSRFADNQGGVRLTYHPVYIIARCLCKG